MSYKGCFISICIPAYKRPQKIDRLLHSVQNQLFTDYEIIITDDSPDESVKNILQKYSHLPIRYYKNKPSLGTPANWNRGISLATGEWIKIMHDDDWFAHEHSLEEFAKQTGKGSSFIFSRYRNISENGEESSPSFPVRWKKKILENPMNLLASNVIGPPSVTLIHNSIKDQYDTFMKWRVDIDFYVRVLKKEKSFSLIDRTLINVGISSSQVTNYCINEPDVELSEGLLLLKKYGLDPLKTIRVYDAWWRILRNVQVRSKEDLIKYTPYDQWPAAILIMVKHEALIPASILRVGVISKICMALSYILNRKNLKDK